MFKRFFSIILIATFLFTLVPTSVLAAPYNIKTDYCGNQIKAEYCQCAFHNAYCERIGMDQSSANSYVYSGWEQYLAGRKAYCESIGHFWNDNECFAPPSCTDRQVYISSQLECIEISDLCGNDPVILYSAEGKECYCPMGYELLEEGGEKICEEVEEIEYSVIIEPGYSSPPLLADGQTMTRLAITGTYTNNDEPVEFNFQLDNEFTNQIGTLEYVSLSADNVYTLDYTTPDLSDFEEGESTTVGVILKYWSYFKNTYQIKIYDIPLFTSESEMIVAYKAGFERDVKPFVSDAKEVEVFVYTVLPTGEHYPINQAEIVFDGKYSYARSDGTWLFENDSGTSDEVERIEFELDLDAGTLVDIDQAKRAYRDLNLFHDNITNFLPVLEKSLQMQTGEMMLGMCLQN
jgi:hypothetical protein